MKGYKSDIETKATACWMIARGLKYKVIGERLGVSVNTICGWASREGKLIALQEGEPAPVVPTEEGPKRRAKMLHKPVRSRAKIKPGERFEVVMRGKDEHQTVRRRFSLFPSYRDMIEISRQAGWDRAADFVHYPDQSLTDKVIHGHAIQEGPSTALSCGEFWVYRLTDDPIALWELSR